MLLVLAHAIDPERRTMRLEAVLLGRTEADVRAHQDQRWPGGFCARGLERALDGREVVAISNRDRMPAIGLEATCAIFREGHVGAGRKRDGVVVVKAGELAEH